MQHSMIRIGNFFFRHRNHTFPLIILALYVLAVPPSEVFDSHIMERAKDMLALILAVSGLGIRALVIGFAYIKRGGMNKKVYAENLVTGGMFGLCRNPLYVGNVLIYASVFLMHGNPLVILLGTGFYVFVYQCIVLAEEQYLAEKFGEGYRAYCAAVPRWLPRLSRAAFREATERMQFNIRRVIIKDYTTIATTVVALSLTELYEELNEGRPLLQTHHMALLLGIAAGAGLMAILVRTLKKRRWLTENPV